MHIRRKLVRAIQSQFIEPHGFAGWLAGWEMALRPSNRRRIAWAVSLLDAAPTDRVLEIGFGPGIAIRELSRRVTLGLVCGVDHSAVMVRQAARRNAAAMSAGRVDLRLGSAEDLPAFAEPFDKVVAVNNLSMWREPEKQLKSIRRLMRSGGHIAIVSQPRRPGATVQTTVAAGQKISTHLVAAGFTGIRSEMLALKPPVVCVIGKQP
jgi:ubiquinone/menaquinone biosynthesis C-methylase UbiE